MRFDRVGLEFHPDGQEALIGGVDLALVDPAWLRRHFAGRTVFIRILAPDEDRPVEDGTHDALLTSGGVYARPYLGAEGPAAVEVPAAVRPVLDPPDLRWPKPAFAPAPEPAE